MESPDEIYKRLAKVEANHENIRTEQEYLRRNQEAIAQDLRITSDNLVQISKDINTLVNNLNHLTKAVDKLAEITDKAHNIELDLALMKNRTESINKLWNTVDDLKQRVEKQDTVTLAVKVFAGAVMVTGVGLVLTYLFGS